ncbi:PulJ/GspJ family protein [Ghiorsea bivora]|uniref:PulJ/GspJ family protein n=1 Tax=Ghiorsea bivora TaxID=1485545 RepID=UPI00056F5D25|nr:prepilin-type N-terminal cleavage/methylation domain-containing protein [Ghiorsea bivora]
MMKGFTLIEVLLAIVVFSLIAAVTFSALGPAGEGFMMIKEHRTQLEEQQWLGKQLRRDVSYLSTSEDKNKAVVVLKNDSRGENAFDELQLLIRDPMYPGLTLVRYLIDEDTHKLKREALSPWARTHAEPIRWELVKLDSFNVEVLDAKVSWKNVWNQAAPPYVKPLAIRVTIRDNLGEMSWDLPVLQ